MFCLALESHELLTLAVTVLGGIGTAAAAVFKALSRHVDKIQDESTRSRTEFRQTLEKTQTTNAQTLERVSRDNATTHAATMESMKTIHDQCAKEREDNRRVIFKLAGMTDSGTWKTKKGPDSAPSSQ